MADAPTLFGKPGEQDGDDIWEWECSPWTAYIQALDAGTAAAWVWLREDVVFFAVCPNGSEAARALERELTRLAVRHRRNGGAPRG